MLKRTLIFLLVTIAAAGWAVAFSEMNTNPDQSPSAPEETAHKAPAVQKAQQERPSPADAAVSTGVKEPFFWPDYTFPDEVTLCGEKIPLKDPEIREMMDREFLIHVWDRTQVILWLKRSSRYFPGIEKMLKQADLPDDLKYLAVAESALIPYIRSRRGAVGAWQFMPSTARHHGLRKDHSMDERYSVDRSTEAAIAYLWELKEEFGKWTLALAAYNCGEARLRREIKEQEQNDFFHLNLPLETERFIYRIASVKVIMENPERYGYRIPEEHRYEPLRYDTISVRPAAPLRIVELANALGTEFKTLKELNPHVHGYHMPTGEYAFNVPKGKGEAAKKEIARLSAAARKSYGKQGVYVVKPGDTLIRISKRSGVPVETIRKLNGLSGTVIRVGQKLRLSP